MSVGKITHAYLYVVTRAKFTLRDPCGWERVAVYNYFRGRQSIFWVPSSRRPVPVFRVDNPHLLYSLAGDHCPLSTV
jgi:hypothetical protein